MDVETRQDEREVREPAGLRRARAVARLLDDSKRLPGTGFRIGIDPVLGVLPVGGDAVAAVLSLSVVFEGARLGAPPGLIARMVFNVLVDAVVGSVPVVGVLADAVWKANERNVALLERYLAVAR